MIKRVGFTAFMVSFIAFLVLSFSSCSEDDSINNEPVEQDNYYVMYIIKGNGPYGRFSNWEATTPDGKYSNNGYQTRGWKQTYGPVTKGFRAQIVIEKYIGGAPGLEIHVSKNDEPFSLKISKTGKTASYSIN